MSDAPQGAGTGDAGTLAGRLAVVTGASSGFGADFARLLAAEGCELVLVARRQDRLEALVAELRDRHGTVSHLVTLDLAEPGAPAALYEETSRLAKPVDVLVANAGVGIHGDFLDQPWERERALLELNVTGLVHAVRLYAADMRARGVGWLLLVSSIGAFQASPGYAIYSASKSFVLSFGEALGHELRGSGVRLSVLCPGVAATEFIETAGQRRTPYQRLMMMPSRKVAEAGLRAMKAGRSCRIPGLRNAIPAFLLRFTPRRLATATAHLMMRND